MTTEAAREETITLRPGLVVPIGVLRVGWALEARGVQMRVEARQVVLSPADLVSPDEAQLLQHHAQAFRALVEYCAEAARD